MQGAPAYIRILMWIEVFKTGTHTDSAGNTKKWTSEDLDTIATKYNNQDKDKKHDAPAVIGHPKTDSPAYGWVKNLKRKGEILLADVKPTVDEFKDWVNKKIYNKVSIALFKDNLLRHVGFLGGAAPAVKGLKAAKFGEEEDYIEIEFMDLETAMNFRGLARSLRGVREWIIEKAGKEKADEILPNYDLDRLSRAKSDDNRPRYNDPSEDPGFVDDKEYATLDQVEVGNPYPNEHAARVKNPDDFQENSFRRKKIKTSQNSISMIIGRLKDKTTTTTQAYRFPRDLYTVDEAKKWLKDHNLKYLSFEPATKSKEHSAMTPEEVKKLEDEKKALKTKISTMEQEKVREKITSFTDKLIEDGCKLTPAQRNEQIEFQMVLAGVGEIEFSDNGNPEQKEKKSALETYQEFLKKLPRQVEFKEIAKGGKQKADQTNSQAVADKALEYKDKMDKKGRAISYTEAVAHVVNQED